MNATEIWTMITAIATVALALFAVLAWHASRRTLVLMRSQETVTKESAQAQVDDQIWGRQVEALSTYAAVLRQLARMPAPLIVDGGSRFLPPNYELIQGLSSVADVDQAITTVATAGLIWHLQHARSPCSPTALQMFENEVIHAANACTYGEARWGFVQLASMSLLQRASDWQREPASRHSINVNVEKLVANLEADRLNKYQKANSEGQETNNLEWPPK
ncbi:hypothetical protein [Arthrobacter sp. A5]|uniref:hypothetical protein n=1 Tax=Arthrobacter sp. A5 TaxID=576926 RepID=UPI003DA92E21